jgi:hypothetical protein
MVLETPSQPMAGTGGMQGSTKRGAAVQTDPDIKQDPISKLTNAKRPGKVIQEVEHLPSKHKALS